jgi:hypothetical protein
MSLTPTELTPARRNRYYYGKLMDVHHFTMEQRYLLAKEWLYNRDVLGPGVVCGLVVEATTTAAGNGLIVHAGLAIDGWGREIIVPQDVTMVPLQLTDQCGQPSAGAALPQQVMVQLCYAECQTDFSPALVSDECGCGSCEAGTIVESYCLRVTAGTAPAVTSPCAEEVIKGLKAGKLHDVLCSLSQACNPLPADPCLALANVTVGADGTLTVDSRSPRLIAPTNRILAQLIACLAQCCADMTPPVATVLQVAGAELVRVKAPDDPAPTVLSSLNPPSPAWSYNSGGNKLLPNAIDVTFTGASLDNSTVTLALQLTGGTFQVTGPRLNQGGPQLVFPAPNVARLFVKDTLLRGEYVLRLIGTPAAASGGLAIMSLATSSAAASDLDGELPATGPWPSGNGQPGGNFGPIKILIS